MKVVSFINLGFVTGICLTLIACGGGGNIDVGPNNEALPTITEDDAKAQLKNAKDDAMGAATKNHELRKDIFTTKKTLGMDTDSTVLNK